MAKKKLTPDEQLDEAAKQAAAKLAEAADKKQNLELFPRSSQADIDKMREVADRAGIDIEDYAKMSPLDRYKAEQGNPNAAGIAGLPRVQSNTGTFEAQLDNPKVVAAQEKVQAENRDREAERLAAAKPPTTQERLDKIANDPRVAYVSVRDPLTGKTVAGQSDSQKIDQQIADAPRQNEIAQANLLAGLAQYQGKSALGPVVATPPPFDPAANLRATQAATVTTSPTPNSIWQHQSTPFVFSGNTVAPSNPVATAPTPTPTPTPASLQVAPAFGSDSGSTLSIAGGSTIGSPQFVQSGGTAPLAALDTVQRRQQLEEQRRKTAAVNKVFNSQAPTFRLQ